MEQPYYLHGSEDSIDKDVYYLFKSLPNARECQAFCNLNKEEDRNIIVINNGVVTNCFKGVPDEVNNGLFYTYKLHPQSYPLLVDRTVPRDIGLKIIRVLRCVLSYFSRTEYRVKVKESLKNPNWDFKLETLNNLNLNLLPNLNKGSSPKVYKVFAFQLGQVLSLIDGEELYTKRGVANYYPELESYLYKKSEDIQTLIKFINIFINKLKELKISQDKINQVKLVYGTYNLSTEVNLEI